MASIRGLLGACAALPLLAACTSGAGEEESPPTPTSAEPTVEVSATGGPPVGPEGEARVVADALDAPWSAVRLGAWTLVSQRDAGTVVGIAPEGDTSELLTVEGVSPGGEGGLLGLAVTRVGDQDWLYAYYTSPSDNRVVRYPVDTTGTPSFGEREDVITGIAAAPTHNGGRLAFGPDGMLYVTTGDAAQPQSAQDPRSLSGKILRLTPEGAVPDDNPDDSPVYSRGHRNPQGLAWDAEGTLWAAEFGQDRYDELNRIEAGGNYGWPDVEGPGGGDFLAPARYWETSEASPSGMAFAENTLFLAGLGGERLFAVSADASQEEQFLVAEEGRLRDVLPGPDGTLWVLTNNTDGRGTPGEGDDRLLEYRLG